jgi:hypothetical protein
MRVKGGTQSLLLIYAYLFEGIRKLSVENTSFEKDFPFPVLKNICHLKLSGVGYQQPAFQANFDLENLEILELNNCLIGKIVGWNSSKSLKKVITYCCSHLSSIPPLDDIPVVSFTESYALTHFLSSGNHEKFTYVGSPLDEATMLIMSQPGFYKSLQYFKLWHESNIADFSFCQNIPVVDLYNFVNLFSRNDFDYPSLPVLYGKELYICQFSLAQWKGQVSSTVVKCDLKSCIDLIEFPEMEALQSLILRDCDQLVGIPLMPSLKSLQIRDCPFLKTVSILPNLTEVLFERCRSFEDLSAFSHVPVVSLFSCNKVTTILPLQRVSKLTIRDCTGITDLEKISNPQDDYMLSKRKVTISGVKISTKLQNIYHLVLDRCSVESVGNIHHLEIHYCASLITTKGLGSITGSFFLGNCGSLTSLHGLQNIPEVSISSCLNIVDFSGLGHHKKLTVRWNSVFEEMLEEFQNEKKHSELFGSIEHLSTPKMHLVTIPLFPIKKGRIREVVFCSLIK